jgi:hypothetical protein
VKLKYDECEHEIRSRTHWYRRRKFCSMLCTQLFMEREKRINETATRGNCDDRGDPTTHGRGLSVS